MDGPITVASFASPRGSGAIPPFKLERALAHAKTPLVAHNLKYDLTKTHEAGLSLPKGILLDTFVGMHLLNEERRPDQLALDVLAWDLFNIKLKKWEEVKDDPLALAAYAEEDAVVCRKLALYVWERLEEQDLLDYWLRIECALVPIIAEMEMRGLRVDRKLLGERYSEFGNRLHGVRQELEQYLPDMDTSCPREGCVNGVYHWKRANKTSVCVECEGTGEIPVNYSSGPQMRDIIFERFGLRSVGKTEGGEYALDKIALPKLVAQADGKARKFLLAFQKYGSLKKTFGTYYKPIFESGVDRVHANIWQTGTVTGRWSYSDPNLQNQPAEVRNIFLPDEGKALISCDYSQIELYLLGILAGQDEIVEAYQNGEDLHELTARAAGVEDPAGAGRSVGKTGNFAVVYGVSPNTLADKLGITESYAQEIFKNIYSRYDKLPDFRAKCIHETSTRGYVTTLLGRRRRVTGIESRNRKFRNHAENQAANSPIQGSAGDLIKCALINCKLTVPEAQPLVQVHDEIVFQTDKAHAEEVRDEIVKAFEGACNKVQPKAEAHIMERWEKK